MTEVTLYAEYECHPLWVTLGRDVVNISPEDLPISQTLKIAIHTWARQYDRTLDHLDPPNSGFVNDQERSIFEAEGLRLSLELQRELGSDDLVIYRPPPSHPNHV